MKYVRFLRHHYFYSKKTESSSSVSWKSYPKSITTLLTILYIKFAIS